MKEEESGFQHSEWSKKHAYGGDDEDESHHGKVNKSRRGISCTV